jgi:hypothetical protein
MFSWFDDILSPRKRGPDVGAQDYGFTLCNSISYIIGAVTAVSINDMCEGASGKRLTD